MPQPFPHGGWGKVHSGQHQHNGEIPLITEGPTNPAELLDKSADYLLEHGWARATYTAADGRVCMMGACYEVLVSAPLIGLTRQVLLDDAVHYLIEEIGEAVPDPSVRENIVTRFNDRFCKDADEAALTLRAAAKRAEAGQ